MRILYQDRTTDGQGPPTQYFLRVMTAVTSFTVVPGSPCSDSTCETPSLPEIFGGTIGHFPRVYLYIEVGFIVNVLDLVDPWLQFPVPEDGRGITSRTQGHGW